MRILLDAGILSHSEFATGAIRQTSVRWGPRTIVAGVHGFARKPPDGNGAYQRQKEALFTIGRLIREGRIKAFVYDEILFERMRGNGNLPICYALEDCDISHCDGPLDRSKFRKTSDFRDLLAKGGKKDRRAGISLGTANQIAFLTWLCTFTERHVAALIDVAPQIGLSDFEIESLRNIWWYQFVCKRSGSAEHYPDVFHLWTAERNGLDAILTLDMGLSELVSRIKSERVKRIEIRTKVLRPSDLLRELRIEQPDPVPMEVNRFYSFFEMVK